MVRLIRERVLTLGPLWLRLIVIGGLLVGVVGIGVMTRRFPLSWILIPPLALPAMVLLSQPEWSVVAIVASAAFVRFSVSTGTESSIVASLMVTGLTLGLWIVRMFLDDSVPQLRPALTNAPLFGFMATAIVSYFWSIAFRDPLLRVWSTWPLVQIGALGVLILLPCAFLITMNGISKERGLKVLTALILGVAALYVAQRFLPVSLAFLNVDGLFSLWFVSLACGLALFDTRLPLWARLVLAGVVGLWMYDYAVLRVTWLSGWIPSLVAIAVLVFMRSRRLFLAFLVIMTLYFGLNWDYYRSEVFPAEYAESGQTRLAAWEKNLSLTKHHVLFGMGPAGYAVYYMSYFPTQAMATHNNYVDVLAQTGIIGLSFCLWFLAAVGWIIIKLYLRLRGEAGFREGFASAGVAGWVGCLVAMGLGDWLFPFAYTQGIGGFDHAVYSWVMLGGLAALGRIYRGESEA